MLRHFKAVDGTKMTFEMVEEFYGCQRFRVTAKGQIARAVTLVGPDTEAHYKILRVLLARGVCDFEDLAEDQFC